MLVDPSRIANNLIVLVIVVGFILLIWSKSTGEPIIDIVKKILSMGKQKENG